MANVVSYLFLHAIKFIDRMLTQLFFLISIGTNGSFSSKNSPKKK